MDTIVSFYRNQQVVWLTWVIAANLLLGVLAALRTRDFRLTSLGDWLATRLLPVVIGYGAAAMVAQAQPDLGVVRDAAWATLTAALLGNVFANLRDLGIPLPSALAGKPGEVSNDMPAVPAAVPRSPR